MYDFRTCHIHTSHSVPETITSLLGSVIVDVTLLGGQPDLTAFTNNLTNLIRALESPPLKESFHGQQLIRDNLTLRLDLPAPWWKRVHEQHRQSHSRLRPGEKDARDLRSGQDKEIANLLQGLTAWHHVSILLARHSHLYWRSDTTEFLEEYLGPNLAGRDSQRPIELVFRPSRYWELVLEQGVRQWQAERRMVLEYCSRPRTVEGDSAGFGDEE